MISSEIIPGTRILYPGENNTLNFVASKKQGIYKDDRGGICSNAPKNFLGSLLFDLNKGSNLSLFVGGVFHIPSKINQPYVILKDVPLSIHHSQEGYEQLGLNAQSVLLKRVCGSRLGVVLKGDLSGVILQPQDNTSLQDGMCINRVWNDYLVSASDIPYTPDYEISPTLKYREAAIRRERGSTFADIDDLADRIRGRILDNFIASYKMEVEEIQEELGEEVFESVLFVRFCQRLGIEVDISGFHVTREVV